MNKASLTKTEIILNALQAAGLAIDEEYENKKILVHEKRGIVGGIRASINSVNDYINTVQKEIDEGKLDLEQGKIVVEHLKQLREALAELERLNYEAWHRIQGEVQGLDRAVNIIKELYDKEKMKEERRQRLAEEGETDEGGRPLPVKEIAGKEKIENEIKKPKKRGRPKKKRD